MVVTKKHAFSIVELAVVLTIIALLSTLALVADSLIRQARLQAVIREATEYMTATQTFYQIYSWYPGDMPNATTYWLTASNGNGNNNWDWYPETFYAWQDLQLAGLIAGSYTGAADSNGGVTIGLNAPVSNLPGNGYHFIANQLESGANKPGDRNCTAILTAEQAYTIDLKTDDGLANSGTVVANIREYTYSCMSCWSDVCTNGNTGYLLSSPGIICRLGWNIIGNYN